MDGKREAEARSTWHIVLGPQAAALGFDDRAADWPANTAPRRLGRVGKREHPLSIDPGEADTVVSHRDHHVAIRGATRGNHDASGGGLDAFHGVDAVANQVQQDLWQSDAVAVAAGNIPSGEGV